MALSVLLLLGSCLPAFAEQAVTVYRNEHIAIDTLWSGQILIDGTVKIAKQATLTISPGTEIAFVRRDADADGLGDAVLAVEGRLMAIGTRARPIRFRSAEKDPRPGDWLEIRVDFSREVHLRYCEIRDSAYTLHAHFTRGVVEDCTIRYNIDGCRLGQARFVFRNNLIEHNQGKGINFRNSSVEAHHNILRHNGSGVFLFESDREFAIHHNNFYGNLDNFRLGDFYTGDVALRDNWWGTADLQEAQATIYDRSQDPEIGAVTIHPAAAWVPASGPRDGVALLPLWQHATAGFVDADPVADDERLYLASWDGTLRALDARGELRWSRQLGDTLDATPLLADGRLFVQSWDRTVHALDAASGALHWRFEYPPSAADDHRQASLLAVDGLVLVPAWNGTLYALEAHSGKLRWSFAAGQPLRSRPLAADGSIYLASGDGSLTALGRDGSLRWRQLVGAPLLSSPVQLPDGVAVVSRDGRVAAYGPDGQALWQRELDESCYYGAPVYHDGALLLATAGGGLWKLDAGTGKVVWRAPLAGPGYATPLVADGRVLVGDNTGALQLFGLDSGDLLARHTLDRDIQSRPLLWSDLLLVGSRDQQLHAFRVIEQAAP